MNIREIINAWYISFNPTDKQVELSEKRLRVCEECPSRKELVKKLKVTNICGECGCPISKKVFTDDYNPCPLYKWADIDKDYFLKRKEKNTLL